MYADQDKHTSKPHPLHDKSGKTKVAKVFGADQFVVAEDQSNAICPAGQRLYRNGKECNVGGYTAIKFRAAESACKDCALRKQCHL